MSILSSIMVFCGLHLGSGNPIQVLAKREGQRCTIRVNDCYDYMVKNTHNSSLAYMIKNNLSACFKKELNEKH